MYIQHFIFNLPDMQEDAEYVAKTIANVRRATEQVPNTYVAIALDTKGSEIRTGLLKGVSRKLYNVCEICNYTYSSNMLIKIIVFGSVN